MEKNSIEISLVKLLSSITNSKLYNFDHGLRPPIGIFNISKSRLFDALESFLDEYESCKNSKKLAELHLEIVESYNAFVDDTYHIFKCFFSINEIDLDKKFAHEQLRRVIPDTINRYFGNVKPFREIYALINNSVKHNHARYNSISIKSIYGESKGYYIEAINQDGALSPHNKIHPLYQGVYTGISYNYDIKRIIISWLIICEYMEKEILNIIKLNSVSLENYSYTDADKNSFSNFYSMINRIIMMKEYYFVDEYDKGVSKFEYFESELVISYPAPKSYKMKLFFPQKYNVSIESHGDGVTKSWIFPYMF